MRSLLPTLVLVAVLINFSQVICGMVIDICNILMNFFIKYSVADVGQIIVKQNPFLKDFLGITSEDFWNPLSNIFAKPFYEVILWAAKLILKASTALIFTVIEFFILTAYALVLILRIVVIWILVILSPLAFASYVLPATRKTFSQWWDNFIQWALMGVIMLFFLYLSGYLLEHTNFMSTFKITPPETNDPLITAGAKIVAELLSVILPSVVSIVILILGLNMSFGGGSGAPGFVKKIMGSPGGMASNLYSYGKGAALSALGKAGTRSEIGADGKKITSTWLDRMSEKASGSKGLGAMFAAPAILDLKAQAKKANDAGVSLLGNASQKTLENMMENGTAVQKKQATEALVSGAVNGKFGYGSIRDKITPEQLKILMATGVKDAFAFAKKDIVKFAGLFDKNAHELAKALSPKEFVDLINGNNEAGKNIGIVGSMGEKKIKSLLENGSENSIETVRNTLQGITGTLGISAGMVKDRAQNDTNQLTIEVKGHIRKELANNRIQGVTALSDAAINDMSKNIVEMLKKDEFNVT
jgi:type IV secretory pathway VirB6-like protein